MGIDRGLDFCQLYVDIVRKTTSTLYTGGCYQQLFANCYSMVKIIKSKSLYKSQELTLHLYAYLNCKIVSELDDLYPATSYWTTKGDGHVKLRLSDTGYGAVKPTTMITMMNKTVERSPNAIAMGK